MKSILEILSQWASSQPNKTAWTFLNDKGDPCDSYTYKELDDASSALAHSLQHTHKLAKGIRILLVFFPGLDFTISLLACFKAGLVAVPVFPPDPRRLKKDLNHFVNIQHSSGALVVLTNSQYSFVKKIESLKSIFSAEALKWPELQWIQTDETLKKGKEGRFSNVKITGSVATTDVAFLQYTSGSTSDPKGVMITHGNLAHNLTLIVRELAADTSTVNVSWLPQYHDMGLIGSYLGIVYCGGSGVYLSPISFLKDPLVWVTAMSRHKGTHTQAPNFAYALVARKYREASQEAGNRFVGLDLSGMRHMINAAEPVDHVALHDFCEIFGAHGLRSEIVFPTYGLAEHTVFVCSGGSQVLTVTKASLEAGDSIRIVAESTIATQSAPVVAGDSGSSVTSAVEGEHCGAELVTKIVGCGYPGRGEGVDLRIVHVVSGQALGEDSVGEIWIDSPSKAVGYWQQPELTAHDFHAELTPPFSEQKEQKEQKDKETDPPAVPTETNATEEEVLRQRGGYLRTGDLGFLHKGELFICGRIKDLLIVRGSNHYPQDIERTAEQGHAALRAGCSAAFAITSGHTEAVVYVAEVKDGVDPAQYGAIVTACRQKISTEHGLALHCVCLLKTRSIPKTTSGKIARSWCKRGFLEGTLSVVHRWDGSATEAATNEAAQEEAQGAGGESLVTSHAGKQYTEVAWAEESAAPPVISVSPLTLEQVRGMSVAELVQSLQFMLSQVAAQGPTPLPSSSVDADAPLTSLGLDSMTLVQFKGVLENRYHCHDVPDEFLFTPLATLLELAAVAQHGTLTAEQRRKFDAGAAAGADAAGQSTTVIMPTRKQPWCPWFTCCY